MANVSMDDLAAMIQQGFAEQSERTTKLEAKFTSEITELRAEIAELRDELHREFALIQQRIDELSKRVVYRDEFEELKQKVIALESKLATI